MRTYTRWLVPVCATGAAGGILCALMLLGRKRRHAVGKAEHSAGLKAWENEGGNATLPAPQSSSPSLTA